ISSWYFNLKSEFSADLLEINESAHSHFIDVQQARASSSGFSPPPGSMGEGHGKYLIEFDFPPPPVGGPPPGQGWFSAGRWIEFTITSDEDITAQSFNALSVPGSSHGPYHSLARVQGIPYGEGSGWVVPTLIPLPAPVYL